MQSGGALKSATEGTPHQAHWYQVEPTEVRNKRPTRARHNIQLGNNYQWKSVNHRREWVTQEGVHTNTVECANSMAKKRLKPEGSVLGRKSGRRADRVQAIAEKCNGSLRKNGEVMLRVLQNLQEHCICIHL